MIFIDFQRVTSTFIRLFSLHSYMGFQSICRNHPPLHQFIQALLQSDHKLLGKPVLLLQQSLMLQRIAIAAPCTSEAPSAACAGI